VSEIPRIVAVALGGALGALGRYGAGVLLPIPGALTILGVNLLGCFAMGVLFALLELRLIQTRLSAFVPAREVLPKDPTDEVARPLTSAFLLTGLLGGFTTFSSFSLDLLRMLEGGQPLGAMALLLASVGGGAAAVRAGLSVAVWLQAPR
jgi:CrcB protein